MLTLTNFKIKIGGVSIVEEATGMTAFVNALTSGLSAEALWGAISPLAPFIVVLTLVALGFYVARKNLKRGSKGKGGTV